MSDNSEKPVVTSLEDSTKDQIEVSSSMTNKTMPEDMVLIYLYCISIGDPDLIYEIKVGIAATADGRALEVNVYPHRFRHTYACQLFDNGAPLDFNQGMLGHEKASTTQIYAQLRGERRRELYRRFF